ncbi:MAG: PaeR7I family type II restriction endonuclease, partial [Bacteroidales bacterium]|nr:PaeR7I family type II restriction endonuclease [Bacteroidales bacterium]
FLAIIHRLNVGGNAPFCAQNAIDFFWEMREKQSAVSSDNTQHGAVLGGKQLDGFIELLSTIANRMGIGSEYIHKKGNILPGFYRPSKDWDLLILTPKKKVVSVIELKSQIGSYGNNFNNRIEEALGSSVDFWATYRDAQMPFSSTPWLGYLLVIGKDAKSERIVTSKKPLYPMLKEFENTSYLERYDIFARKLICEKDYSSVGIIWTNEERNFGDLSKQTSIEAFLNSYVGNLYGHLYEY